MVLLIDGSLFLSFGGAGVSYITLRQQPPLSAVSTRNSIKHELLRGGIGVHRFCFVAAWLNTKRIQSLLGIVISTINTSLRHARLSANYIRNFFMERTQSVTD